MGRMPPNEFHVEHVGPPAQADMDALVQGLRAFNRARMGDLHQEQLACFAKDAAGTVVGGVNGYIAWGWLTIELLWVNEDYRGLGVGRTLMERIERYAAELDVRRVRLETTSFQALDFYRKLGYEVFAELPDCPPGEVNYYLRKPPALPRS